MFNIYLLLLFLSTLTAREDNYIALNGKVKFSSVAQQEIIKASSSKLGGILNVKTKKYAFKIPITSFQGFNSELQREHFNENYMESAKYPYATFEGTILGDFDMNKDGEYDVNAKGNLKIHGVEQERTIKSTLTVMQNQILVKSNFTVILEDHRIKIPKVVNQKLAPVITVEVEAAFTPKSSI